MIKELMQEKDTANRKELIKKIKSIEIERKKVASKNEMDSCYKRMEYIRYADDFIIGINSSQADSRQVKENIKTFLHDKLNLKLSQGKTLITHSNRAACFLSHHLYICKSSQTKRDKAGKLRRVFDKKPIIKIPPGTIKKKLLEYHAAKIKNRNGKEKWIPVHRSILLQCDDLEVLNRYNAEIRGLYNYYSLALNVSTLQNFKYIMEYSMYKTFAGKYKTTVRKICRKYIIGKKFTINYKRKDGKILSRTLYNQGFRRNLERLKNDPDKLPKVAYTYGMTSLIDRLQASKCELCGSEEELEMHHIRKMIDIKAGKEQWQIQMIARNRKTMAVCKLCHYKIHHCNK